MKNLLDFLIKYNNEPKFSYFKGLNHMFFFCPFHQEKTPSFVFNMKDSYFYCFSCTKYINENNFNFYFKGGVTAENLEKFFKSHKSYYYNFNKEYNFFKNKFNNKKNNIEINFNIKSYFFYKLNNLNNFIKKIFYSLKKKIF